MSKPQVIFLDAVGTLFGVRGSVGEIYSAIAQDFGVVTDAQAVNDAFYASFQAAEQPLAFPNTTLMEVPELEYQWWHDIAQKTFDAVVGMALPEEITAETDAEQKLKKIEQFRTTVPLTKTNTSNALQLFEDFEVCFRRLYGYFALPEAWEIYPDIPQTLDKWRREGVEMGIISNFDTRLHAVLDALGLRKWFKTVTISSVMGVAKPNPEIFAIALEKHNCTPEKAWHIGDSVEHDYKGAKAAGLKPFLLKRS